MLPPYCTSNPDEEPVICFGCNEEIEGPVLYFRGHPICRSCDDDIANHGID